MLQCVLNVEKGYKTPLSPPQCRTKVLREVRKAAIDTVPYIRFIDGRGGMVSHTASFILRINQFARPVV